jgi:hypothetical protein
MHSRDACVTQSAPTGHTLLPISLTMAGRDQEIIDSIQRLQQRLDASDKEREEANKNCDEELQELRARQNAQHNEMMNTLNAARVERSAGPSEAGGGELAQGVAHWRKRFDSGSFSLHLPSSDQAVISADDILTVSTGPSLDTRTSSSPTSWFATGPVVLRQMTRGCCRTWSR